VTAEVCIPAWVPTPYGLPEPLPVHLLFTARSPGARPLLAGLDNGESVPPHAPHTSPSAPVEVP
jgi:hypothetical protein